MNILGMFEPAVAEFEKEGTVYASGAVGGFLYALTLEEKKLIRDWEKRTDNIVFAAMRNDTTFGRMFSVLYVSKHEEEWEAEREWTKRRIPSAYVFNRSCSVFSEYGSIEIEVGEAGGLIRRG